MNTLVTNKLDELAVLCKRHRVRRLELFGSAALDSREFDPDLSDLDLLVEFLQLQPGESFDAYFDLHADLQSLFGQPVDLVVTRAIRNRYFLQSVNRSRVVVYAA